MNAEGPVLRDIHLPPAAWWPPAPGWWLLALCVIAVAACVAWWMWRRARRGPLRAALREMAAIESAFAVDHDAARLADACSRLLRRVARHVDPAAATRAGMAWREFLHRHARDAATRQALDDLDDARFRADPSLDAPALLGALRAWCRTTLRHSARRRPESTGTMQQGSP